MKHYTTKYSSKTARNQAAQRAASKRRSYHSGEKEFTWTIEEIEAEGKAKEAMREDDGDILFF